MAIAGFALSLATAVFPFDCVLTGMVRAGLGIEALCTFLNLTQVALDDHLVRLALATPHDRRLRKPGSRGWSIADTIRLIAWRVAGVHPEIIGQRLEKPRSANAVRAKARRLGLAPPPRKALYKPDPETLRDPPPDFAFPAPPARATPPEATCGRAAGAASVGAGADGLTPTAPVIDAPASSIVPPTADPGRSVGRRGGLLRSPGQRELPLFGIIGLATSHERTVKRTAEPAPLPAIPSSIKGVDLGGDLTWFARVKRPLLNPAAVWVGGLLTMGGLGRHAAAERLGVTCAAFRSFRSRAAVPVDFERTKLGNKFSERGAHATLETSGYILRQCKQSAKWFWVHKSDRGSWLSPCVRKRDRLIEGYANTITIITEAMLDAGFLAVRAPFASSRGRVTA